MHTLLLSPDHIHLDSFYCSYEYTIYQGLNHNIRPTNGKLLKGVRALRVPPCLKDHLRCLLIGRIKCRTFWDKIPGCTERVMCLLCRKKNINVLESKQHMWLECENNGQELAWETTKNTWQKTTDRNWPNITAGLIRGVPALSFKHDFSKDAERLRILITVTIWAIWKSRNKSAITNQDVAPSETSEILKELISDIVRKNWNVMHFMEGIRRSDRQHELCALWANKRLVDFNLKTGPNVDFS